MARRGAPAGDVKGFYSPNFKKTVNIKYPYIETLLTHDIIHRKIQDLP